MYWHVIWHIFWKISHDIGNDKSFDISSDSLSDITEVRCKRQLPKWVFGRRSRQKTIEIWSYKILETPGKVVVKTNQKQTLVLDWNQESGRSFNRIFSPDFLARCFIVWRLQEANLWIRTSSDCERVVNFNFHDLCFDLPKTEKVYSSPEIPADWLMNICFPGWGCISTSPNIQVG
jgi:hypothetical protein